MPVRTAENRQTSKQLTLDIQEKSVLLDTIELPEDLDAVQGRRHISEIAALEWMLDADGVQRLYLHMIEPDMEDDFAQNEDVYLTLPIVEIDRQLTEDDLEEVFAWVAEHIGTSLSELGERFLNQEVDNATELFREIVTQLLPDGPELLSEVQSSIAADVFLETQETVTELTEIALNTPRLQELLTNNELDEQTLQLMMLQLAELYHALAEVLQTSEGVDIQRASAADLVSMLELSTEYQQGLIAALANRTGIL